MATNHGETELRQRKMVPRLTPQQDDDNMVLLSAHEDAATRPDIEVANGNSLQYDAASQDSTCEEETSLTVPLITKSDDEEFDTPEVRVEEAQMSEVADESSWQIGFQVFFPYIIAGFGMVAAGMLLDVVQVRWKKCSYRNTFCISGPLWGESTGDRWISFTKGQLSC